MCVYVCVCECVCECVTKFKLNYGHLEFVVNVLIVVVFSFVNICIIIILYYYVLKFFAGVANFCASLKSILLIFVCVYFRQLLGVCVCVFECLYLYLWVCLILKYHIFRFLGACWTMFIDTFFIKNTRPFQHHLYLFLFLFFF